MISGQRRQVDVRVEGTVMGQPVRVAVECKLVDKPIGVGLVDQFHGKPVDLGTDKGFTYSDSGYTKPALGRAHPNRQHQPDIALLERSAEFDYEDFLDPDCPSENCYTGSIGWRRPNIERIPNDPSLFQAGSCDTCGVWVVECGNCTSVNEFVWGEVECGGCEASWQLEYDRDCIEGAIQQLTTVDGNPFSD